MNSIRTKLGNESGFGLVEALIASMILTFGLLAVAGLSMSTAGQSRMSEYHTDQALAGQLAHSAAHKRGFFNVASSDTSITVGEQSFAVKTTVNQVSARVKEVQVDVAALGRLGSRTFTTRLYAARDVADAEPSLLGS